MHSSVLQNKKYIKFAEENTVEVIAVSAIDSGISKGDPRAGTYKEKDESGKEVEYLVSWPGLTLEDMNKLNSSKATSYNDSGGIPYVAIVDPHTGAKIEGYNGGSASKIMESVEAAQKMLTKEHGKPIKRKVLVKFQSEESSARKLLDAGELGKAWSACATLAKKAEKMAPAFQELSKKMEADLIAATEKRFDELEALVARGETKEAVKELKEFSRYLAGTSLEERAKALADKLEPPKS